MMKVNTISSYNVQIWCGLRVGYTKKVHKTKEVRRILQEFVDKEKFCVTLTKTEFIYTNGFEPGVIIGLINYPRFPKSRIKLKSLAIRIADKLKIEFKQQRVTITTPNKSIMLGDKQ